MALTGRVGITNGGCPRIGLHRLCYNRVMSAVSSHRSLYTVSQKCLYFVLR